MSGVEAKKGNLVEEQGNQKDKKQIFKTLDIQSANIEEDVRLPPG